MGQGADDQRRQLPAVDRLLQEPQARRLCQLYGRRLVGVYVRSLLDTQREALRDGWQPGDSELQWQIRGQLDRLEDVIEGELGGRLRRVINATGIFLHTNLGRAPLPGKVVERLPSLLDAACDLEFDLANGRRGQRNRRVRRLLTALTEAEAAAVVNNNAAAVLLALVAIAHQGEVIVSRGELVEIGGSFRIPEILNTAGVRLVEVGTTNRTRLADYEQAISPKTALLLKVYPSNYEIRGFVASVPARRLAELGRERGIPVAVDEGSGLLRPSSRPQLQDHDSMQELVAAGCDLVMGSGDKLCGGPQAGLLVGRHDLIERCGGHPLYRTLRCDRMALAALEGVLRLHLAEKPIPMDSLWPNAEQHQIRLELVGGALNADIVPADAYLGGGTAPEASVPGTALALSGAVEELQRRLRLGEPSVVGYIREDRLILDLRTVAATEDQALLSAVQAARLAVDASGSSVDLPEAHCV